MPTKQTSNRTSRYSRQSAVSQNINVRTKTGGTSPYRRSSSYSNTRYENNNTDRYNRNNSYSSVDRRDESDYLARQYEASVRLNSRINVAENSRNIDTEYNNRLYESNSRYSNDGSYSRGVQSRNIGNNDFSSPRFSATDELTRNRMPVNSAGVNTQPAQKINKVAVENVPRTKEQRLADKRKVKTRIYNIIGIAIVFMMCVFMIYRQTVIFGKNQQIDKLKTEYNAVVVTNEGVQADIDKSVELGNLETMAKNELGMVDPDSSQIFYVDMGTKDKVIKSAGGR